ncbi:MAG: hypothetical protein AAFN10_09615 [Bacteroidota bacterium]
MNLEEQIDAYLNGRLSEADRSAFETQIAQDPQLAEEVALQQEATQLLLADRQSAFKAQLKEFAAKSKTAPVIELKDAPVVALWQRNWVRIAAAVALLIGLGFILWPKPTVLSYPQMAEVYFEPYPDRLQIRSGDDDSMTLVQQALLAYNQEDYQTVVNTLAELKADDPQYLLGQLYRANAYLSLKQPAPAIEILEDIYALEQSAISEITAWYLALAYLQADDASNAKAVLQGIAKDEASVYRERAQEILGKWGA